MAPHSGGRLARKEVVKSKLDTIAQFSGLADDSRDVKPGYLFAALPGTQADGRAFIADAVRRGAVAVLGLPAVRAEVEAQGVRFIADENPRAALARLASVFFAVQPRMIAAVTGTNGKTSVAVFLRQIWERLGHPAASIGTIGAVAPSGVTMLAHTTPGPIELHRLLAELKNKDIERVAFEASSHGLDQHRLDGVRIAAAGFTNITRDHLDYHADFSVYLAVKLRLFSECVGDGGVAVINADAGHAEIFIAAAEKRGLDVLTVGERGAALTLLSRAASGDRQNMKVIHGGRPHDVVLPLAGGFQAANALVAAGLAIGLGDPSDKVFAALAHLKGAPGRLEKVAYAPSGAPVYVDYAHTPDALEMVLCALRPHVRHRLHVVFGCGGDRDKGKRPLMGEIAAKRADVVIVTDDNPRNEVAAEIRKQVLAGCPGSPEIGDRAKAIRTAIASLDEGDILVIAGKGHEMGQIVGHDVYPFSDREEAVMAALELGGRRAEHMA